MNQENKRKGYIKIARSFMDHWLYPKDREFTEAEAWLDILLLANHSPKEVRIKNRILVCGRGQSLKSLKEWGTRWNWKKGKVNRFLELLRKANMIETVNETVTTRITIINYNSYQDSWNENRTDTERDPNEGGTRAERGRNEGGTTIERTYATNKELKELKELKNEEGMEEGRALFSPALSMNKETESDRSIPDFEEFKNYALLHGFAESYAQHLYDSAKAIGWRTQKGGQPIIDWKAYLNSRFKYQREFLTNMKNGKATKTIEPDGATVQGSILNEF